MKILKTTFVNTRKSTIKIIIGISEPSIDPIPTQRNIEPLAVQLPEYKSAISIAEQIEEFKKDEAAYHVLYIEALEKNSGKAEEYLTAARKAEKERELASSALKVAEDTYLSKWSELYMQNPVYSLLEPGQELIEDNAAEEINEKLSRLGKTELLREDGTTVHNLTGVSYYIKENSKWEERRIEEIGETVPEGGFMADKLTPEITGEIDVQREQERIDALSREEKAKEREALLESVKSEARRKKEEAEIADEDFDAKAWFSSRKAEIEAKYA
jgi:hypothetical protein